jgi:PBP1b-binding outer membrane lipoprotein LpoB
MNKRTPSFAALIIICLLVFAFTFTGCSTIAPIASAQQISKVKKAKEPIKDSYIVVLNDDSDVDTFSTEHKPKVNHIFKNALKGLHMSLTDAEAEELLRIKESSMSNRTELSVLLMSELPRIGE